MSSSDKIMFLKREDEVSRHLSWAMKGSLPATECFVKFSFATSPKVGYLLLRKRTIFSPATGVRWRGLEGKQDGTGSWSRRLRGFVI